MNHASAAVAPRAQDTHHARTRGRAAPGGEALRPARGIVLGLGLSSLIWAGLVALVAL